MTREEYVNQMERLRAKYGRSVIDQSKIEVAWRYCSTVPLADFRRIVEHFLGEDIKPKVSDIQVAVRNYRRDSGTRCPYCEDSGWLMENPDKLNEDLKTRRCVCCGGPPIDDFILGKIRYARGE